MDEKITWVLVKDKLPKSDSRLLITNIWGDVSVYSYNAKRKKFYDFKENDMTDAIYAWAELPKGVKIESQRDKENVSEP